MKLSHWAKLQGISYQTAWNWIKSGKMPVPFQQLETGTILVFPEQKQVDTLETYIYSRVSSPKNKDKLEAQAQRCLDFCSSRGYEVSKVVKEVASGVNDKRPKLMEVISLPPKRIVVEHKDRLTRFGFHYLEKLLTQSGFELVVINRDQEERDDLLKDFIAIITSFCCRLYGLRRSKNKLREVKKLINEIS